MITFCDIECMPYIRNNVEVSVVNLSSFNSRYTMINLMPPMDVDFDDINFDSNYHNYIMNDKTRYLELVKIAMCVYYGIDVYILVTQREPFETITNSLQKLIQHRYGLHSNIAYNAMDMDYLCDTSFSVDGLINLDIDKENYTLDYAINNPGWDKEEGIE